MLVSCANCGAPLDVGPNVRFTACRYCKAKNEVGVLRTLAPETPPNWRPPPVWTPPPGMAVPPLPLRYHRAVGKAILLLVAAGFVVPLIFGIVGFVVCAGSVGSAAVSSEASAAAENWDGKTAFRCDGNDRAKLVGKKVKDARGPLVFAGANCELTLVDCDLEAPTVLEASGNARVRVERGRIAGTSEVAAASARGNARIVLEGTRVESKGLAFDASNNAQVDARRASHVEGSGRASGNAEVMRAPATP